MVHHNEAQQPLQPIPANSLARKIQDAQSLFLTSLVDAQIQAVAAYQRRLRLRRQRHYILLITFVTLSVVALCG